MDGRRPVSAAPRLLLRPDAVDARREVVRGPLAPLAVSLAADLARVRARPLFIPPEKARMTRVGGRCTVDGALLTFDPFEPRRHTCPVCGREYDDEAHYRWWIFWYQLWLAERAVHGAALALLAGDAAAGAFARDVLQAYAERYLSYPNRDNVLGPTRLFFSTYLESIWLLMVCVATDLLDAAGERALGAMVRDRIVEPSRALVASYDEGASNRQVWNAAALAAAARLLDDRDGVEHAVEGRSGVLSHLRRGLLADGTWYEGENYHQFAHRGLWYGVTLAEHAGLSLPDALRGPFERGFIAPFLTALPDLTLPARRDSQWAISLRQWRWAESCELGLARRDEPRLTAALASLYDPESGVPRRDTGRWRAAAESERNEPPSSLTRADLGWRSLLHARAELPAGERWTPESVLLPAQGLAVFRRDRGRLWAALDYGTSGGGHGHPDRLNLLLADGPLRWLDDMGTGSYVERTLHWYRSTLAHNAPLVGGKSQERVDGRLVAHDECGEWGWVCASAEIAPGVRARRAVVVGPRCVVDRVAWEADREVTFDLPWHVDAEPPLDLAWRETSVSGAGGLEDGFDFLRDVRAADVESHRTVALHAPADRAIVAALDTPAAGNPCRSWVTADVATTWLRATAPSSPSRQPRPFHIVRAHATRGTIVSVWDTRSAVDHVRVEGARVVVRCVDGSEDAHEPLDDEWRVTTSRDELVLRGSVPSSDASAEHEVVAVRSPRALTPGGEVREWLGESHYRRSEESWAEAGSPRAHVRLLRLEHALNVGVVVVTPHPTFVPAGTENLLDNERAEINGHGVQLYLRPDADPQVLGWLLVPEEGTPAARVIALTPDAARVPLAASWRRTHDGYAIATDVPLSVLGGSFGLDLIVNETAPGRERRRGQLVLSGARGEFVYLQGDRHDPKRFLRFRLAP
jgi:hypothetical protein